MTSTAGDGGKTEELDLFYEEVKQVHGKPLWQTQGARAQASTVPYLWKYADFRPLLFRSADIVPMEMAERRVLVMANPGIKSDWQATSTLLANLQIIKPGEVAPSHRHTASALRLVVEGQGAYTAVNGEKSYMDPGDFITTPNWTWHDHGNESDKPMIWLDGLDVPFVNSLEANFMEVYPEDRQPVTSPDDLSLRLYGGGGLVPTWVEHKGIHSPLLNYKFESTYDSLKQIAQRSDGSPYDGVSVEYTNPFTGGPAIKTIGCFASLLAPGQHTKAHRHTGGTIYHVIQGKGYSIIDGRRFDWDEKDTFVVPSWNVHEHVCEREAVLFSYNDSPILQPLGLYREEAYEENGGHQQVQGVFEPAPV